MNGIRTRIDYSGKDAPGATPDRAPVGPRFCPHCGGLLGGREPQMYRHPAFDDAARTVNGLPVAPAVWTLLCALRRQFGTFLTSGHLASVAGDTKTVAVYIHSLRKLLADTPLRIVNRRGAGYRLTEKETKP